MGGRIDFWSTLTSYSGVPNPFDPISMTTLKRLLPLLTALTLSPFLSAQEETPAKNNTTEQEVPAWLMRYENLPPEEKESYREALGKASRLFNQKRVFEALNTIYEAEKIFDGNPAALNLKGACYVEFRDFDQARVYFNEALAISPASPNVIFNLVEMDFVTRRWTDCEKRIEELLTIIPEDNISMRRLLEFKTLLAYLKTDRVDQARTLAEKYDYLDDNPFHYYANAALAYHDEDNEQAERWLASARRVFRSSQILSPWQDTLIEFGYIKSFYGEELDPSQK